MLKKVIIGMLAGIICGLYGTGGGMILVPSFVYILKIDPKKARGTSLCCMLVMVITSSIFYYKNNYIYWSAGLLCAIGGIFGGYLGAKLLKKVPDYLLKIAFTIFIIYYSYRMLFLWFTLCGWKRKQGRNEIIMKEILIGIFSGIFSGVGMGGGTILIFLLTIFARLEQHIAQATNLIYFVPTAISAIIVNYKNKNIDIKLAIFISICGIIGAIIGSMISIKLNVEKLRKSFGIFLAIIAIHEIYTLINEYKKYKKSNNKGR